MNCYPMAALERTMKIQEVILRAMAKEISWWQAAEIIGITDRQMLRHWRYKEYGYDMSQPSENLRFHPRREAGWKKERIGLSAREHERLKVLQQLEQAIGNKWKRPRFDWSAGRRLQARYRAERRSRHRPLLGARRIGSLVEMSRATRLRRRWFEHSDSRGQFDILPTL
jgi:hypothetical protein